MRAIVAVEPGARRRWSVTGARGSRVIVALALAIGLQARAGSAASLDWPIRSPERGAASLPAYLGDCVSVRLRDEAAARAHAVVRAGRVARSAGAVSARLQRLGLPGFDAALAALGDAWVEPTFPGEGPPPAGSDRPDLTAFYLLHLPAAADLAAAIDALTGVADVREVHPIGVTAVSAVPNDSLWARSVWFDQPSDRDIDAPQAWDVTTGSREVVVAIIDTGVIPYHPDLGGSVATERGNLWTNPAEAAGVPGFDDDDNGYVDDVAGWDFVALSSGVPVIPGEDWRDPDNDPNDYTGHGTLVAGLIGALGNNGIGVAGTAWRVSLMPLRVGWSEVTQPGGMISMGYVAQAVLYAARNGADVINISLETTPLVELSLAINEAVRAGVVVVVAAGNNGSADYIGPRNDVVTVAASTRDDQIAPFSNRRDHVDLCAPGQSLSTTANARPGTDSLGLRQPGYQTNASGTSFSTPLVSGAVALLEAQRRAEGRPRDHPYQTIFRLRETTDDISALNPGVTGYGTGRLNLDRLLREPPHSRVWPLHTGTTGAGLVIPMLGGGARLAFATVDRRLFVVEEATGDTLWTRALPGFVHGGIAAAQLGGDFGFGMFVAAGRQVAGIALDGQDLPGWPVEAAESSPFTGPPSLGDLDGDGILEVVCANLEGWVYAWRADGRTVDGFPRELSAFAAIGDPVALADLDGQPGVEIAVMRTTGLLYLLRGNGESLRGPPLRVVDGEPTAPVILSPRPGEPPLIVVASPTEVHGLRADGTTVFRVPRTASTAALQDPAVGDLDGDGDEEIVLASDRIDVLGSDGTWWAGSGWPVARRAAAGPPLLGHLAGGGLPEVLVMQSDGLAGFSASGTLLRGFPALGGAGAQPTIYSADGTRSRIFAGSGDDSLLFLYSMPPASWSDEPQPWPTPRGNAARTGSRIDAPVLAPVDPSPPFAVSDLSLDSIGVSRARVAFTAPADQGQTPTITGYELRWSLAPIVAAEWPRYAVALRAPALQAPGARERLLATGLPPDTDVHLALRSRDRDGNWSALSNPLELRTLPDRTGPEAVTDLVVGSEGTASAMLEWTAPADDGPRGGAERYDVRWSPDPIDDAGWSLAQPVTGGANPASAGARERVRVGGLPIDRPVHIALRSRDDAGNWSGLSNLVAAFAADRVAPVAVSPLSASQAGTTAARLAWAAPTDDDPGGRAVEYELRRAPHTLTAANFAAAVRVEGLAPPKPAGGLELLNIPGLEEGVVHHFAIRSRDPSGNWSALSPDSWVFLDDHTPPATVSDLAVLQAGPATATFGWTAPSDDGLLGRATLYDLRYGAVPLSAANFDLAVPVAGLGAPQDPGSHEAIVVRGLAEQSGYHFALRSRDRAGNWSPISASVPVRTPGVAPGVVGDLRVVSTTETAVRLRWTGTGDDGGATRPDHYEVAASTRPIPADGFESSPHRWTHRPTVDPGGVEEVGVDGLATGTRYWFAVRAWDEVGNAGPASNQAVALVIGGPLAGHQGVGLACGARPSRAPVQLYWQRADRVDAASVIRIYDLGGRRLRDLDLGVEPYGVVAWDGLDAAGRAVSAGLYFARIESGGQRAETRIVLLR